METTNRLTLHHEAPSLSDSSQTSEGDEVLVADIIDAALQIALEDIIGSSIDVNEELKHAVNLLGAYSDGRYRPVKLPSDC